MNHTPPNPAKETLFAYFAHKVTPLERQQVEDWLKLTDDTALYFAMLDEWERHHPQFQPDFQQAHARYMGFIETTPQLLDPAANEVASHEPPVADEPRVHRVTWFHSRAWLGIAASVLLILGLWVSKDGWYYKTLTNDFKQLQSVNLPDGSQVLLGTNSSLRYRRFGFEQGTRQVWLNGEARFSVVHTASNQRFTVQMPGRLLVEVLGTQFVVNSRPNATRVALVTGRIRMRSPRSVRPLDMKPGDVVTVSAKGVSKKRVPFDAPARVTWQDHRFIFQNTSLTDVAQQLHDVFGIKLRIDQPALMARTVTGTFQAETANDIIQALTLMMNLHVEKTQNTYRLTQ